MRVRHLGALIGLALVLVLATGSIRGQDTEAAPDAVLNGDVPYSMEYDETMANSGWFADVGVYVLQPRWQTNQALATSTPLGGGRNSFTGVDFKYDFSASPFINLGYVTEGGAGIRVGYWDFHDDATATVVPAGGGSVVSSAAPLGLTAFANVNPMRASTRLAFQVWDGEITQQLENYGWLWDLSGGVRYVHINQIYNVTTSGAAGAVDDLASSHSLNAAGPTLALKGRIQLGNPYFSLYGSVRGSLVYGDNAQQSRLFSATGVQGDMAFQASRSFANITELDVGVWYQRRFPRVTVAALAGLVGQYWDNVGNAANTDTFTAFANDESQNNTMGMGLFGARTSLQLWY